MCIYRNTRIRAKQAFSSKAWIAQIIAGWALTLLAVAGFTGLIRSD